MPCLAEGRGTGASSDQVLQVRVELRFISAAQDGAFEVGEAIPYEVTIKNSGRKPISVRHRNSGSFPPMEYTIVLTDWNGVMLPHASDPRAAASSCVTILANDEKLTYGGTINGWGNLRKPGRYTARAYFGRISSGARSSAVGFVIKPRTADRRREYVGGTYSPGYSVSTPVDQYGEVLALDSCEGIAPGSGSFLQDLQNMQFVADSMRRMATIHTGMTRADLLKVFTTEGGIYSATFGYYVYRGCPYFKVNVTFNPVNVPRDKDGRLDPAGSPDDIIESISKPFVEPRMVD
jgi:hypothetical protein